MRKLNLTFNYSREQVLAVGGFATLLIASALTVAAALLMRSESLQALADQHDQLASLQTRSRSGPGQGRQNGPSAAPAAAFLEAPTSGLATAQFQAYLSQLLVDQHAVLVSSGVPATDRDDKSDAIRLEISLNATFPNLQSLLYRLESGTPYVFVDGLSMQPSSSGERAPASPVLKINLTVHGFWHRKTA